MSVPRKYKYLDPLCLQLAMIRNQRNFSQADVAYAGKFAQSQVSEYETGSRVPRVDSLRRWADVLGYDLVLVPKESK